MKLIIWDHSLGWVPQLRAAIKRRKMATTIDERSQLVKDAMQTMDAHVWAKAFVAHVEHNPAIATDVDTMIGWFANAIMCGYDKKGRS